MNKKIIAIIPARSGSKGIPNKNITLLGGLPLIAYSIVAAYLCTFAYRIIVSTDSEDIAVVAKTFGAETPFLRPAWASTDTATDDIWMYHLLGWLQDQKEDVENYIFLHLRPTTPLRDIHLIKQAIQLFAKHPEATSLRSAHVLDEHPYKMFVRDNGYFTPFGPTNVVNLPRQSFSNVYVPNGYIDILSAEHIIRTDTLHGDKILAFETPPTIELDTQYNLAYLETQVENHPLHQYLKRYF